MRIFIHFAIIACIFIVFFQSCEIKSDVSEKNSNYFPALSSNQFPRLFGMQIGSKHYQDSTYIKDISKLDVAIMGFYNGWYQGNMNMEQVLTEIKKRNPEIIIGQYTILNETDDDPKNSADKDVRDMVYQQNWWLKNSNNKKVQWTERFEAWDLNISQWVVPDKYGSYYPEWIANRDFKVYFKDMPLWDIWYFDNIFYQSRIIADWDLDGKDDDPSSKKIQTALQEAHVKEWQVAKSLRPDIYLMGNSDNDLSSKYYKNKLNGAFLEALMGYSWSLESQEGWDNMMMRYHTVLQNTLYPNLVAFNVAGDPTNYKFMRYGLCSCLLNDGYFSFSDEKFEYSSVPWFDEYDVELGLPIEPPVFDSWTRGIYKREFTNGIVLVNPTDQKVVVKFEKYYRRIKGKQDSLINNGTRINILELSAKDGIILLNDIRK